MIPTLRVLMHMGSLQRLLPFWLTGMAALIYFPQTGLKPPASSRSALA